MPQVRVEKKNKFTQIDNQLIRNRSLSLKAKGLLIYMLSLPGDWDYSISGLSALCKEGKSAIRSAVGELIEQRYITRSLVRDENGLLCGYEYTVYEEPQPPCGNRTAEGPMPENRTEQKTDRTNTEETNTPCSPPEGDGPAGKSGPQPGPRHKPEAFAYFWGRYPKKRAKQAAIKAWDKLKPDAELCHTMLDALRRAVRSPEWAEQGGKFIPHFSKWLNQRLWEDEGVDLSLLARDGDGGGYWADDPEAES